MVLPNLPNEIINLILEFYFKLQLELKNILNLTKVLPVVSQPFLFKEINLINERKTNKLISSLSLEQIVGTSTNSNQSNQRKLRNENLKKLVKILHIRTKDRNETGKYSLADGEGIKETTLIKILTLLSHVQVIKIDSQDSFGQYFDWQTILPLRETMKDIRILEIGLETGPGILGFTNASTLFRYQRRLEVLKLGNLKTGWSLPSDYSNNERLLLRTCLSLAPPYLRQPYQELFREAPAYIPTLTTLDLNSLSLTLDEYQTLFEPLASSTTLKHLHLRYLQSEVGDPLDPRALVTFIKPIISNLESFTLLLATKKVFRLARTLNPIPDLPSEFRPADELFKLLNQPSSLSSSSYSNSSINQKTNLTSLTLGGQLCFTPSLLSLLPPSLKYLNFHACSNDKSRLYSSGISPSQFLSSLASGEFFSLFFSCNYNSNNNSRSGSSSGGLKEIGLWSMETDPLEIEDEVWNYDSIEACRIEVEKESEGRCKLVHDIRVTMKVVREDRSSGGGSDRSKSKSKGGKGKKGK